MAELNHSHEEYAVEWYEPCRRCGKAYEVCAFCNKNLHVCEVDERVLPGYRVIPEFPDYMVNKQATVRHIESKKFCLLLRVTSNGGAMINVLKEGKKYTRAAQDLRDSAFSNDEK